MQNRRWQLYVIAALTLGVLFVGGPLQAYATADPSSAHYQASQLQFGSSDTSQNCSTQYCATTGLGGSTSGNSASASYSSNFGTAPGSEPQLEVVVGGGVSDLGTFSSSATSTSTITVKVRNYLSSGYVVQLIGKAPTYAGHSITSLATPTASTPGTEQFGVNAVANTSPVVGANLLQVPTSSTSFGTVNPNYNTPNKFMYSSGDAIASSAKSSGETDYTISLIINISNVTPAGKYSSDFSAVVVPAY